MELLASTFMHETHCGFNVVALSSQGVKNSVSEELTVAFNLDAVLFSVELKVHYKTGCLKTFFTHEKAKRYRKLFFTRAAEKVFTSTCTAKQPTHLITKLNEQVKQPIHLVTKLNEQTLRAWNIRIDRIHFLAEALHGQNLNAIQPNIFFDDQHMHKENAKKHRISAAKVRFHV
ncbi:cytosolic 5'-nucleotidase 1A-like [Watersipora subatra]|uniref:cytosolic 5'-nucleotidase 1A-like n=1 Tax=Watersipora subatra TaxID=2589382 RepID=UPI00355BE616